MRRKKLENQKGIGLIETLVAMGVGIIVITSMVSLATYTVRTSLQSKLSLEGSQLASRQTELVRAFRDANTWSDFISKVSSVTDCFNNYCYMTSSLSVVGGKQVFNSGTAEAITVYFQLSDLSGGNMDIIRVSVTTSWNVGSDTKYAHNYTELSSWRENR